MSAASSCAPGSTGSSLSETAAFYAASSTTTSQKENPRLIAGLMPTANAPKGTRTPVSALRGPRPGPLDDGGGKPCKFYHAACRPSTNYGAVLPLSIARLMARRPEE